MLAARKTPKKVLYKERIAPIMGPTLEFRGYSGPLLARKARTMGGMAQSRLLVHKGT